MRVKAIKNAIKGKDAKEYITIGREYTVYGILTACWSDNEYPTYIIWCDRDKVDFISADFFEVMDPKLSKYWVLDYGYRGNSKLEEDKHTYILHKNWLDDPTYLEYLYDISNPLRDPLFAESKREMDEEFIDKKAIIYQDETIKLKAEEIGDLWVLCPKCSEAWGVEKYQGVIRCPNSICQVKLNNPYAPKKTS